MTNQHSDVDMKANEGGKTVNKSELGAITEWVEMLGSKIPLSPANLRVTECAS